jgi:oxygen-independent coproporphyrinogen-3 oxidase
MEPYRPPVSDPPYQALYIHLPFCASRCLYCDFESEAVPFDDPRIDAHIDALIRSLDSAGERGLLKAIQTVYIGGGTPSFVGAGRLRRLLTAAPETAGEFTLEANPESLTDDVAEVLADSPVNRISIGVQSLNDRELAALGRIHDADAAAAAIARALLVTGDVSIDLMCGIPQQDQASLSNSLSIAAGSGAEHISVYPLTLEEGTPLALAAVDGSVAVADDEEQADMLLMAEEYLAGQGFKHYEIASYARPGRQSRHNRAYWTGVPYIGLGRGAVGMAMVGGRRLRNSEQGAFECLNPTEQAAEDLMLGLRLMEGIADEMVAKAAMLLPAVTSALEELVDAGLLTHEDGRHRLSGNGWLLGNQAFGRIWALASCDNG